MRNSTRAAHLLVSAILLMFPGVPARSGAPTAASMANSVPVASTEKTVKSRKYYRYRGRASRKGRGKPASKRKSQSAHKP